MEAVQALLHAGADCNAQNRLMGSTPLHMAAQSTKAKTELVVKTIDLLLEYGANLQQADSNRALPLDYAKSQPEEIQQRLQEKMPELYQAIEECNHDKVASILAPIDIATLNQASYFSRTPLEWTVAKFVEAKQQLTEWAFILQLLLDKGADPKISSTASDSDESILYTLLNALRGTYKSSDHDTGRDLRVSVFEQSILACLDHGAVLSSDASMMFHQAARFGELNLVQYFVEQLAIDVNLCGRQKMTALHFAARSGQVQVLKYLLGQEAVEVNALNDFGQTALDAARVNGKDTVVSLIEEYMSRN